MTPGRPPDVLVIGPRGYECWHGPSCQGAAALAQHTHERPCAEGPWLVAGEYRTPLRPCACADRTDRTVVCACVTAGDFGWSVADTGCRRCRGRGWHACPTCGGTGALFGGAL